MRFIHILFLVFFVVNNVFAGGGASRAITAGVVAVATGGTSLLTGATLGTAIFTGSAAGVGYATTGNATVGVNTDGDGRNPTVNVTIPGPRDYPINIDTANFGYPDRQRAEEARNRPWEPKFTRPGQTAAQREAEYQEAKKTFEIKTSGQYNFGIVNYLGRAYHMETNGSRTFLSTTDRGGWEISPFNGYDSTTTFTPTSEMERLAMRSFNFEETPLIWHFSRENINGYWYNRAYTDSAYDIMVPEGEVHNIAAPKWYTEMRKMRQQEQRARVEQTKKEELIKKAVEGYMRESQYSLWVSTQHANNWSFNQASAPEVSFARECARTTLEYYDRGLEIAEAANVARLYEHAVAFVVPGGIDNLRNFAFEGLPAFEFVSNIGRDLAVDVATCKAGRFVSRMARTSLQSARQTRMASRGGRNNGNRIQAVRADADNYLRGLKDRRVLSNKGVTRDGHEYYKFEERCEYMGVKFRKGDYISRDELHHEWELFRGPTNHRGAISPITGRLYKEADPSRILKLP